MNPYKNTSKNQGNHHKIKNLRNLTEQICHLTVHCRLVN